MNNGKKIGPPDQDELRKAMLLVLASLPHGADIHYFWKDGVQQMQVTLQDEEPSTYRINRNKDGSGVVTSSLH